MPRHLVSAVPLALVLFTAGAAARDAPPFLGPAGLPVARYPAPIRPVAPVVSDRWRDEDSRERVGEATHVMDWLGLRQGMSVADIGAGSGYYTVRLAAAVGAGGHVLAQDVVPDYVAALRARVAAAGLANVAVGLGEPGDPRLPPRSVDVAVMVHMYHEIALPSALLGNLAPSLRPGGRPSASSKYVTVSARSPTRTCSIAASSVSATCTFIGYIHGKCGEPSRPARPPAPRFDRA